VVSVGIRIQSDFFGFNGIDFLGLLGFAAISALENGDTMDVQIERISKTAYKVVEVATSTTFNRLVLNYLHFDSFFRCNYLIDE
jgi:hypothetical protein